MTERERRQRRLARERRMGHNRSEKPKGTFAFRSYVTVILGGAFVVLSMMQTETSLAVCDEVKQVIAYQIPTEDLMEAREVLEAVFFSSEDGEIPVFYENRDVPVSDMPQEEQDHIEEEMRYAPDIYDSP